MLKLCPVILSGGSGTRLWPLSRELHPKQFILFGDETLFGKTIERVKALDQVLPRSAAQILPVLTICNEKHRFFASAILQEKKAAGEILLEPCPRNTAPAIALAAQAAQSANGARAAPSANGAQKQGDDPILLILPSDQILEPASTLGKILPAAMSCAEAGRLVCFGLTPRSPATGYGYIETGGALAAQVFSVRRFTEKPDAETAAKFISAGTYLWNSGIFLFRASVYLRELERLAPEMYAASVKAWASRKTDGLFTRFEPEAFAAVPAGSVDYTVMEHTDKAAVASLAGHWNDLGSWEALYEESRHDEAGNALSGDVLALDTRDSYLHSTHRLVTALGLKDIAVIESADAVLVMERSSSQQVGRVLTALKTAKRAESDSHMRVFRPWGSYELLFGAERFQVKRLLLNPGAAISRQYHHHRAEHWVVVKGTARVTRAGESVLLREDQSAYIPIGMEHCLENPGLLPLEIIEVQTGSYLGEDDIVRLEDKYGR